MNGAQRVRIEPIKKPCAAVIDRGVPHIHSNNRSTCRVILDHRTDIEDQVRFVVEAILKVVAAEMQQAGPALTENTDAIKSLTRANTEKRRSLPKVARWV